MQRSGKRGRPAAGVVVRRARGGASVLAAVLCVLAAPLPTRPHAARAQPAAHASAAQDPADGVALVSPRRLVRVYDFEDTDERGVPIGLGLPFPRNWYAMGRDPRTADPTFLAQPLHQELTALDGYPNANAVGFDQAHTVSGRFSLRLGLDGGNTGAFLEVGSLPIAPQSDYLVTAWVRTESLSAAAGRVRAYFVDEQGRRLDASVIQSQPIRTAGRWTRVELRLVGDEPEAAWLGLELRLDQPAPEPGHPLGAQQIVLRDVRGDAWFDDVAVWQLPRVELSTSSPVNVVRGERPPSLRLSVRDLSGQGLLAEAALYDVNRRRVAHATRPLGRGAPPQWLWSPKLPGYGWYLATLSVREVDAGGAAGEPIAETVGAVLWLPAEPSASAQDLARFVVGATGIDDAQLGLVPTLLEATGLTAVRLSAWTPDTTLSTLDRRLDTLDGVLDEVLSVGREASLALHPLPEALLVTPGVNRASVAGVFGAEASAWSPYLAPFLMRDGQRVQRWVLGEARDATLFYTPDLEGLLQPTGEFFRALAPGPRLLVPWRLDQAPRRGLPAGHGVALYVPPHIAAHRLGDHLSRWLAGSGPHHLELAVAPANRMAQARRVTDLAVRVLAAWEHRPAGLLLSRPWTAAFEQRDAIAPDPLLGVYANLARRLAGRQVVGRLDLGPGLNCLILDGPGGGMLAAWNESAPTDVAEARVYLGENPVRVDVWGNRTPVPLESGRHVMRVPSTPVFYEGIDTRLALLRAGFRLDPPFIESTQTRHNREVVIHNPWPQTISGSLRFLGPESWSISPGKHLFSIASGQSARFPVVLSFPFTEEAGDKRLTALFEFNADKPYAVELDAAMRLGLEDIEFEATLSLEPAEGGGPDDAVVLAVIKNTGETDRALYVFVSLPGHRRDERIVPRLEPGQTVIRRFRIEGGGPSLREAALRTGVRETNGPAVLNRVLRLEDAR